VELLVGRTQADVVIIGAGIMGASCAWYLAERGLRVVALEKEASPAMGSTGKSAAGVRVQFTTPPNIGLSMYSLPVYRGFAERYGQDIGYRDIGYLLLAPEKRWEQHLASVELQRSLGTPVEVIDLDEAQRFLPFSVDGQAGATFGPWGGVIDPHMATHAWISMARDLGADFRMRSPVEDIDRSGGGWVVRSGNEAVHARYLVNASGAWSGELASKAGLGIPVGPKHVNIFLSGPIADRRTYPMTIDLGTGVYVRSEGDRVLFGRDNLDQPFGFTMGLDWDWLEQVLITGVDRFPWWEELGVDPNGSWWGYYGVSPDNSPIIGAHPGAEGWIDACGFSGHGIMHAPAAGKAVSEIVCDGKAHTVDVCAFGHERFGKGGLVEANIF
jgi:sarcosine oxidase subunit beta